MTYAQLLLLFVALPSAPLVGLAMWDWRHMRGADERAWRRLAVATLVILMVVATVYTIPWDGHLIAMGVWSYRPALLLGVFAGRIPLEELLFFPLQTLLIGLWFLWLAPRAPHPKNPETHPVGRVGGAAPWRVIAAGLGALGWLGALGLLLTGWRVGTYLGWELVWALPSLVAQILIGGDILWRRRGLVVGAICPVALYLCCVDALAIHLRIWVIDPRQSLDMLIAGVLPLEEFIFFLATTTLVGFGLILGVSPEMRERIGWLVRHAIRAPLGSQRDSVSSETR